MALKGIGVNNDLYVVNTYYDPESYTTPTPSVGDYVVADFVASDYVQSPLDIPASAFTLSCDATVINVRCVMTSSFAVSVDGDKFDFASASITATSSISCNGGLLHSGASSVSAVASTSTNATQTHSPTKTITATATLSGNANVSYTSAGATPSAVVSTISVGGIIFNAFQEGRQDDYTWDDFSEDSTIDRTWNEWFGGQWHPGMIVFSKGFGIVVNGGLINSGTGSFTGTITTSVNANKTTGFAQPKDLLAQFSIASDYIRFRGITKTLASAFSENFIGSILHLGTGSFSSAYSFSVDGNATYRTIKTITGAFAPSVNANVAYDIIKLLAPTATLQANGNVSYAGTNLTINAFNTVLSFGRLITIADPWNILTVPVETKTFIVPIETRQTKVLTETRVNTTTTETRKLQVPEETRKIKIFKPTFTNRSSIPKVRQEA